MNYIDLNAAAKAKVNEMIQKGERNERFRNFAATKHNQPLKRVLSWWQALTAQPAQRRLRQLRVVRPKAK